MSQEVLIALGIVAFGITIIALALRPLPKHRRTANSNDASSGDIPNTADRHQNHADADNDSDGGGDGD